MSSWETLSFTKDVWKYRAEQKEEETGHITQELNSRPAANHKVN